MKRTNTCKFVEKGEKKRVMPRYFVTNKRSGKKSKEELIFLAKTYLFIVAFLFFQSISTLNVALLCTIVFILMRNCKSKKATN